MAHRTQRKYGENLFQGTAGYYSAVDAAKGWESEKKDYRGGVLTAIELASGRPLHADGLARHDHQLGCGEAVCNKTLIVACNYDPPGNYIGRRPY